MLVGLVGALAGYDGHFEFKSGSDYGDEVPYVAMRVMLAMFGVGMVPLAWFTSVELGLSWRACHLVTLMVLLGESVIDYPLIIANSFQMLPGFASLVSFFSIQCSSFLHSARSFA